MACAYWCAYPPVHWTLTESVTAGYCWAGIRSACEEKRPYAWWREPPTSRIHPTERPTQRLYIRTRCHMRLMYTCVRGGMRHGIPGGSPPGAFARGDRLPLRGMVPHTAKYAKKRKCTVLTNKRIKKHLLYTYTRTYNDDVCGRRGRTHGISLHRAVRCHKQQQKINTTPSRP